MSISQIDIQEAGRGGRDGSIAKAILIWSIDDSRKFSQFPITSREHSMMEFAETKNCRRQVLLDALGAEEAFCSGCDNCNALPKKQKKLNDWEKTYKIIQKARNFYTREEIEETIFYNFNQDSLKIFGKKIWTHSDVTEITNQLMESGRIFCDKFLWKGKLRISKNRKILNSS